MLLKTTDLETPIGGLRLVVHRGRLCGLAFLDRWNSVEAFLRRRFGEVGLSPGRDSTAERVASYFQGEVTTLDDIPVDPGGSVFQRQVWAALRRIPVGTTTSYSVLARSIDRPSAVRAVATANATNPIAVVIPCHRVVHADGSISGYGGGVERKRWLLRHEASGRPFRLRGAQHTVLSSPALSREDP